MSKVDFTVGYEFSSDELKKLKGAITDAFAGIDISSAVEESAKVGASKAEPSINYGALAGYVQKGMRGISGYSEIIGATSKLFKEGFGLYGAVMTKNAKEDRYLGGTGSVYNVSSDPLGAIYRLLENMDVTSASFDKFLDLDQEEKDYMANLVQGKLSQTLPYLKDLITKGGAGDVQLKHIAGLEVLQNLDVATIKSMEGNIKALARIGVGLSEKGAGVVFREHMKKAIYDIVRHDLTKEMMARHLTGKFGGAVSMEKVIGDNPNKPVDILIRDPSKNLLGVVEAKTTSGGGTQPISADDVIAQVNNLSEGFTNELKKEFGEGEKVSEAKVRSLLSNITLGFTGKSVTSNYNEETIKDKLKGMLMSRIYDELGEDLGMNIGEVQAMISEEYGGRKAEDIVQFTATEDVPGLIEAAAIEFKDMMKGATGKLSEAAADWFENTGINERFAQLDAAIQEVNKTLDRIRDDMPR